jgi:nucleotide-binding universal stress UspA family protein
MIHFKKILLPVDGSQSSKLAKQHAISLATAMESEILLVYVSGGIPAFITGKPREEAIKAQREEADLLLAPYRKMLDEQSVGYNELVVSAYNAGDEICKIAREENCDLIVMGSRGLSDLEGVVMGSVTHRVLARCGIPVLVVR